MLQLRPYQLAAIEAVKENMKKEKTSLLHMAMGLGKTETAFGLIEQSEGGALLLVNRVDLVRQTAERFGAPCGIYCASLGSQTVRRVTFASPQSLREILNLPHFPLVIVDEAHRCRGEFRKLVDLLIDRGSHVVGLSATPWPVLGDGELFKKPTFTMGIQEGIKQGYLVRPKLRATQEAFDPTKLSIRAGEFDQTELGHLVEGEDKARRQIDEALRLIEGRKCCVWATVNIKHCEMIAKILKEKEELAVAFHSNLSFDERNERMALFKKGVVRHLVFVSIVSEGFDHKAIDTVIFLRPTRSSVLAVQTAGRGLRPYEGKSDCVVLDFGRVFEAIGPLDNPIIAKKGERKGDAYKLPPYKFCPKCFSYVEQAKRECPECGLTFVAQKKFASDLTRSTERHAVAGAILSDEKYIRRLQIKQIILSHFRSKAGRLVIAVKYIPKDFLEMPIIDYLALGEYWLVSKARQKLSRLGLDKSSIESVLRKPETIGSVKCKTPREISYETRGRFHDVVGVHYE